MLRPDLMVKLEKPIDLYLFDGEPATSGQITHELRTTICFRDGTEHPVRFLVTQLHSSAPIVLGLPWLQEWNPDINWRDMTLNFREFFRGILPLSLPNPEDKPSVTSSQRTERSAPVAVEEVPEEEEDTTVPDAPLLPGCGSDASTPQSATPNKSPSANPSPTPSATETPESNPPSCCEETPAEDDDSSGPEEVRENINVRIVGAAPFATLLRDGCTAFTLYMRPADDEPGETLGATAGEPTDKPSTPLTEKEVLDKYVPKEYHDFADVFSEETAREMPPHRSYDHRFDFEEYTRAPHSGLRPNSETELKVVKDYLEEMLGKGFIRPSSSPFGAPVVFAKKKDGSLRICVDYRELNKITRKNRYPLPLINDLVDQLRSAKIFTKLDLRAGYNNIRIAEGQEWITAFRTRYGAFEYMVMPFGLANAPATFQHFMNDIFRDMTDIFVVIYLDDILIFSENEKMHPTHVRMVLERLRKHNLHAKPEKCDFHCTSVEYLGLIISPDGISMDPKKVKVILAWPPPENVKQLQSFLGFANFYRRFIDNYSGIVKPFTRLLKKDQEWAWTSECTEVFRLLKEAFTTAPILRHFDPALPIILECDASDFAIAGIISQVNPETQEIRPVAFHARTMGPAELNYDIYDKELLAIVETFQHWRAYLEGANHQVTVFTDHNNLQYFTTTKQLSRRQARWSEFLAGFDFLITYRPGRLGEKPDALTRRSDVYPKKSFIADANAINKRILLDPARLSAALLIDADAELSRIRAAPRDAYFRDHAKSADDTQFTLSSDGELLLRDGLVYVPDHDDLRFTIIRSHHDHMLRGHPGTRKTVQLIMRTYFWPGLRRDVTRYIRTCHTCLRAKPVRHKPYGLLKPLPVAERPWSSVSLDHIVELPLSDGYDALLVVVCRLTKMALFIPCHTTDTSPDFAKLFIKHVFAKHGMPSEIVSDRGSLVNSKFFQSLCKALHIQSNLSTAFHPESDGQTERINQIVELYLRIFCSYQQDDWVHHIPFAEFVYNNTPHSATGVSPFFANKGYNPKISITLNEIPAAAAEQAARDFQSLHRYLREQVAIANESYARHANPKRTDTPDWQVGDLVWVNMKNIRTRRPAKKLDWKRMGPYPILAKIGTHAYRVKLPKSLSRIHNVFHVNLLEKHAPEYFPQREAPRPPPIEADPETGDHYEVEQILDSKVDRGKVKYYVQWLGYTDDDNTWEPLANMENAEDLLHEFHERYPDKPNAKTFTPKVRQPRVRRLRAARLMGPPAIPSHTPRTRIVRSRGSRLEGGVA